MSDKFEAVLCIVNSGFSETVMDAARECGARGGTVINARGTAKEETEKLFNISIHPEKEIVLILVPADIKDAILHAIYQKVGLNSEGQGIAFSLPVDDVVGLTKIVKTSE
ncbi:MAG: P-II family nitrogen regulator [Erysipelotrichaceae bacterium]|nr:P-II family nitrogen regulator [Erysipelotrichaceae bacterium]